MKNFGKVRSTVEPESLVIDEFSVWLNTDIVPVEETLGEQNFNGFEYNQVRYEKNEYIKMMSENNQNVETKLTDVQLALVELYEGLVV